MLLDFFGSDFFEITPKIVGVVFVVGGS